MPPPKSWSRKNILQGRQIQQWWQVLFGDSIRRTPSSHRIVFTGSNADVPFVITMTWNVKRCLLHRCIPDKKEHPWFILVCLAHIQCIRRSVRQLTLRKCRIKHALSFPNVDCWCVHLCASLWGCYRERGNNRISLFKCTRDGCYWQNQNHLYLHFTEKKGKCPNHSKIAANYTFTQIKWLWLSFPGRGKAKRISTDRQDL